MQPWDAVNAACVHLIGRLCRPLFHQCNIIFHYSLIHSLAVTRPPSLYPCTPLSPSPSLPPSLPPSPSRWPLPACLRGNYHSTEMLSYCTAMLYSALPPCIHTEHIRIWTYINKHLTLYCRHALTSKHVCTALYTIAPLYTKPHTSCIPPSSTPQQPVLPLYHSPHRLFLPAIVLPL